MFVGPVCVRSTSHSEEAAGQCKGSAQLCHHPLRPPSLLYVLKSAHPARTGQCRTACVQMVGLGNGMLVLSVTWPDTAAHRVWR